MTTHVTAGNRQPAAHPCPFCGSILTSHISDFERCGQCGRQFNQQDIATAPARARAAQEAQHVGGSSGRVAHVQEPGVQIEQEALADKAARRQNEPA
jgi:ribosomal protein S27AE